MARDPTQNKIRRAHWRDIKRRGAAGRGGARRMMIDPCGRGRKGGKKMSHGVKVDDIY